MAGGESRAALLLADAHRSGTGVRVDVARADDLSQRLSRANELRERDGKAIAAAFSSRQHTAAHVRASPLAHALAHAHRTLLTRVRTDSTWLESHADSESCAWRALRRDAWIGARLLYKAHNQQRHTRFYSCALRVLCGVRIYVALLIACALCAADKVRWALRRARLWIWSEPRLGALWRDVAERVAAQRVKTHAWRVADSALLLRVLALRVCVAMVRARLFAPPVERAAGRRSFGVQRCVRRVQHALEVARDEPDGQPRHHRRPFFEHVGRRLVCRAVRCCSRSVFAAVCDFGHDAPLVLERLAKQQGDAAIDRRSPDVHGQRQLQSGAKDEHGSNRDLV